MLAYCHSNIKEQFSVRYSSKHKFIEIAFENLLWQMAVFLFEPHCIQGSSSNFPVRQWLRTAPREALNTEECNIAMSLCSLANRSN